MLETNRIFLDLTKHTLNIEMYLPNNRTIFQYWYFTKNEKKTETSDIMEKLFSPTADSST